MAGGGGKKQVATTQQTLPAWLDNASQDALGRSSAISQRPYEEYGGARLAGFTGDQTAAQGAVRDMQGQTGAALTGMAGQAAGVMGQPAPQVTAGSVGGMDLSRYMNPYLQEVEGGALTMMDRQRQLAQGGMESRAIGANAFGGSRMALQQGVTDAEYARSAGDLSANLRSAGFGQALQTATGDVNRDFAAQQANQGAHLQNLGLGLQGLQLGGQLQTAGHSANMADIDALGRVGLQQQQQAQAGLDIAAQDWSNARGWDQQQLTNHLATLRSIPYAGGSVSTAPGQGGSPAMGALGGAASGAAMGTAIMPGWGTAIGGVVGGVAGYFGSR